MLARLEDVLHEMLDADLLLLRGRGPVARAIGIGGRSVYSHAAMFAWWGADAFVLQMTRTGGQAVTLASQVARWPGRWDWYRANPKRRWEWDRGRAAAEMRRFAGVPYGYRNLLRAAAYHLPLVRLWARPTLDDQANGQPHVKPTCSQAVAIATRRAGVDAVLGTPDWLTEPADLARSPFYKYRATLVV